MFTGIVVAQGVVKKTKAKDGALELEIEAPALARELKKGDSIAVNGVCLTAVASSRRRIVAHAIQETLARSTLGGLERNAAVNLELAARLSDRLGGHLVQGHVDGVARVVRVEDEDGAHRVWLSAGDDILRYLVSKGSVTVDGVSLTVVDVGLTSFQVALIPYTLATTSLGELDTGSLVNIEVDVIAKYVERLTASHDGRIR